MKKKILFIILGALLILALIFVLWFWFFGSNNKHLPPNTGSFGTSTNATNSGAANAGNGNGQAPFGGTAGNSTQTGDEGSGSGGATSGSDTGNTTYTAATTSVSYYTTPSDVTWFGGESGGGYSFSTTPINDINSGSVSGSPNISKVTGADGSQVSLLSSLVTILGGCLAEYGAEQLIIDPATTAVSTGLSSAGNFLASLFGFKVAGDTPLNPEYVSDTSEQARTSGETITQCLSRTLGRIAVQAITQSTVNWINSGFNGQPAFVQDYGQFFSNVADQAAGNFIQGTGLAFLCSPFQLQVKIAIAQSYADSRSGGATASNSCTLTGVVGNVNDFLNGDFSQGGWNGFLQFTTVPANNPYTGYIAGELALNNQVIASTNNAQQSLSNGFQSVTKQTCAGYDSITEQPYGCTTKITDPGSVVNDAVSSTFQGQLDSLQLGDSIDQILGALGNALVTKVLYGGFGSASQSNSSSGSNTATSKADTLMNSIEASVTSAQQYASIAQSTIGDIQTSQGNLATLADCWSKVASSSSAAPSAVAQANTGFNNAVASINQLQAQVGQYNSRITSANSSIAQLQTLQTNLLLASTNSDVSKVQTSFTAIQNAGAPGIYTSTDITSAQQDRTSQQSHLALTDQNTSTQLAQCYAIGQ